MPVAKCRTTRADVLPIVTGEPIGGAASTWSAAPSIERSINAAGYWRPSGVVRVVAYFEHIGRIEGMIARNFESCFAIDMQLSTPKREQLTETFAWLVNRHTHGTPDNRLRNSGS
jgi:hypothetical protein